MADNQMTSTGIQEAQTPSGSASSLHDDEKEVTSITSRPLRIRRMPGYLADFDTEMSLKRDKKCSTTVGQSSSKKRKKSETNGEKNSTENAPAIVNMKKVADPSFTVRAPVSLTTDTFPPRPLNIALQVSEGCRIGPIFDEIRIRSLPPYNSLPYPEQYTRVVQDLMRCAHRPEDVYDALKIATNGEPSTIIKYFHGVTGHSECKNIPVVANMDIAWAWLADLLESLGCCKKLFIPVFIASEFICKQCFTWNQEQKRLQDAAAREGSPEINVVAVEDPAFDTPEISMTEQVEVREEERQRIEKERQTIAGEERLKQEEKECETMRIEEEKRKAAEEKLAQEEREKTKIAEETKRREEAERNRWIEQEKRKVEKKLLRAELNMADETEKRRWKLRARKIEERRRKGREEKRLVSSIPAIAGQGGGPYSDLLKTDLDHSLPVLDEVCVIEVPILQKTDSIQTNPMSSDILMTEVLDVVSDGEKIADEEPKAEEEEMPSVASPRLPLSPLNQDFSLHSKFADLPLDHVDMVDAEELERVEAEQRKIEKESLRILERRRLEKEANDRLREERLRLMDEKEAVKRYYDLNAYFLFIFRIPGGRSYLRPDIGNPVISRSCRGISFNAMIRTKVHGFGKCEKWQIGDEEPMDSSVLKKITTHSCTGVRFDLEIDGTMLELWQRLLLRCPKCITTSSMFKAFHFASKFSKKERHLYVPK